MKQHRPPDGRRHTQYQPKRRTLSLKSAVWRRLRAQVLAEEPLCIDCKARGIVKPATDVDHINNDGDDNRRENLASRCHECHSRKTRAEMNDRAVKVTGCDERGFPLDPDHHWHR